MGVVKCGVLWWYSSRVMMGFVEGLDVMKVK